MQGLHSTIYLPRAKALNPPVRRSRSQAEPLAPRAVRPGGAINLRGEAASTFGNTGKHRPGPDPNRALQQPSPLKGKRLTMICASLCSFKSCSLCTPKERQT